MSDGGVTIQIDYEQSARRDESRPWGGEGEAVRAILEQFRADLEALEMNRDDILRMAREAGLVLGYPFLPEHLERFAALVAAAEREACARVCEETTSSWTQHLYNEGCIDCAKSIRALPISIPGSTALPDLPF